MNNGVDIGDIGCGGDGGSAFCHGSVGYNDNLASKTL